MKKRFMLLSFLFIMSAFSYGQSFQAGVKFDHDHLNTSPRRVISSGFLYFSSVHLTGSIRFSSNLAIEARMGYNWSYEHYSGPEAGIFSKYYYKNVYAIGGITYHHVNNEPVSTMDGNYYTHEANLLMPSLGLGYNPGGHFALELMLQYGAGKEIRSYYRPAPEYSRNVNPLPDMSTPVNLEWITKIGISYNFDL
ncbi:MAG: hypothetical protein ACM3U0_01320 [archaeon]